MAIKEKMLAIFKTLLSLTCTLPNFDPTKIEKFTDDELRPLVKEKWGNESFCHLNLDQDFENLSFDQKDQFLFLKKKLSEQQYKPIPNLAFYKASKLYQLFGITNNSIYLYHALFLLKTCCLHQDIVFRLFILLKVIKIQLLLGYLQSWDEFWKLYKEATLNTTITKIQQELLEKELNHILIYSKFVSTIKDFTQIKKFEISGIQDSKLQIWMNENVFTFSKDIIFVGIIKKH